MWTNQSINQLQVNTDTDTSCWRIKISVSARLNSLIQYLSQIGVSGRIELSGFGNTFFDELNQIEQEAFALVNASLGYEFENYGGCLFANNIFDDE